MNQDLLNTILRTLIAYFLVLVLARFIGRKIIAQMTFFDFVVGVSIGSVSANLAIGQERSVLAISIILIGFAILAVLTDLMHIKSNLFRKMMDSKPEILIKNGELINERLRKTRITIDELNMQLREKNIFNIADVEFAVIEIDGKLSVLPKSQKQPLTPSDMKIPTPYKGITKDIIVDGIIIYENLNELNFDEKWLYSQLKAYGIKQAKEVLYAGVDTSQNLYISRKNSKL
jgi:uncharacterized membrane protein YcaP (DUF421 family)